MVQNTFTGTAKQQVLDLPAKATGPRACAILEPLLAGVVQACRYEVALAEISHLLCDLAKWANLLFRHRSKLQTPVSVRLVSDFPKELCLDLDVRFSRPFSPMPS